MENMQESPKVVGPVDATVISPAPRLDVKKKLKESMLEFATFIREQCIIGLAIAFVLGGAVNKLVTSLVQDIIQPAIGMIFGSTQGLKSFKIGSIMLGNFAVNAIDFVIIAFVVYFVFKKLHLERLDKKKS